MLNHIAHTLRQQGRLDEALQRHEEALLIYQKILGPVDLNVGITHNLIAMALQEQGKLDGAKENLKKSLSILKEKGHLGWFGGAMHNLGRVLQAQGQLDEAMKVFEATLVLRKKCFGP